jgi:hypothetical protein
MMHHRTLVQERTILGVLVALHEVFIAALWVAAPG